MRRRKQILVVDNNDDARAALDEETKQLGHDSVATWSGIEALGLLASRGFDVLLVDNYLPDMYIGDFLERVSRFPVRPKVWVMQAKPAQDMCTYGSRCYSVVEKKQVAQIFERFGTGFNDGIPESSGWKH